MRRGLLPILAATAALSGCLGGGPPEELAGLWAAGPAACDAGLGVRFERAAVSAHFDEETQVLLDRPDYEIERRGERVRVRISYQLPKPEEGARPSVRGVLILERGEDGWLHTRAHRFEDPRTGSAHVRIAGDPAAQIFRLRKCGPDAWIEGLRGRRDP